MQRIYAKGRIKRAFGNSKRQKVTQTEKQKKTMERERLTMEKLYKEFELQNMEGWLEMPRSKMYREGGYYLLSKYRYNFFELLLSVYPNYPWNFEKFQSKILQLHLKHSSPPSPPSLSSPPSPPSPSSSSFSPSPSSSPSSPSSPSCSSSNLNNEKHSSVELMREYMEKLYREFELKNMEEWKDIRSYQIARKRGGKTVLRQYGFRMENLLGGLYPNYAWEFSQTTHRAASASFIVRKHRARMDRLFDIHQMKSLDEWMEMNARKKITSKLLKYYAGDLFRLLCAVYPNYPWQRDIISPAIKSRKFKGIDDQRKFMERLFIKYRLVNFEDWHKVSRKKIAVDGGSSLVLYYKKDLKALLSSIYPNYPWKFAARTSFSPLPFKILKNQARRMDQMYYYFQLDSLEDWVTVPRTLIQRSGGKEILIYYKYNLYSLLSSIYPNYPWHEKDCERKKTSFPSSIWLPIHYQRKIFDRKFNRFQFQTLDDWLRLPSYKFGKKFLFKYSNDISRLLSTIYPYFPWEFDLDQNLPNKKVRNIIEKYHITQKKDWYRIPNDLKFVSILKSVFPSEKWKKSNFKIKSKKSSQRLLFAVTQKLYPSLLIFEDYHHPKLITSERSYELDLFIPALQMALEYQGEHHYDDLPANFPGLENCTMRDELKEKIATDLAIKIVYIPYWWDQTLSSLLSSLQDQSNISY